MHPDTMRLIDRWVGIPLCFLASFWPLRKLKLIFNLQYQKSTPSPETIVFICVAEIGALVVAYPAIQEARRKYPNSRICFITAPTGLEALKLMGFDEEDIFLLEIITLKSLIKDLLKIRRYFRKRKVSAIILEPFTRFSNLLSIWIEASKRVGFFRFKNEGVYLGNILTHRLVYNSHLHASQLYFSLTKALVEKESNEPLLKERIPSQIPNRLRINVPDKDKQKLIERLKEKCPDNSLKKIVLLNANASDIVPLRKWPLENFIELGKILLKNPEITVVLTGSIVERKACSGLATGINPKRTINFAGETSFKELITLYSISDLLITNDSGPVHFASTTSIPILALFGPETPKIFGPMSPKARVISMELSCSPCISVFNQKLSTCKDNQCMKKISIEMVTNEIKKITKKLN